MVRKIETLNPHLNTNTLNSKASESEPHVLNEPRAIGYKFAEHEYTNHPTQSPKKMPWAEISDTIREKSEWETPRITKYPQGEQLVSVEHNEKRIKKGKKPIPSTYWIELDGELQVYLNAVTRGIEKHGFSHAFWVEESADNDLEVIEMEECKLNEMDVTNKKDLIYAVMELVEAESHASANYAASKSVVWLNLIKGIRERRAKYMDLLFSPEVKKEAKEKNLQTWCLCKHLLSASKRLAEVAAKEADAEHNEKAGEIYSDSAEFMALFAMISTEVLP